MDLGDFRTNGCNTPPLFEIARDRLIGKQTKEAASIRRSLFVIGMTFVAAKSSPPEETVPYLALSSAAFSLWS